MPRRYTRDPDEFAERFDLAVSEFPAGRGPALSLSTKYGAWQRLGPGQETVVDLGLEEGGGAYAWGMTGGTAVVWIHFAAAGSARAYAYHCPPGPMNPMVHSRALATIGCNPNDAHERQGLFVILAAATTVTDQQEAFFLNHGVIGDHLFTYGNCRIPAFGVSTSGCVGEPR